MRVERITRYPVKGLAPEHMEEVELTRGEGLPHDRRFAFAQGDSAFDPADPKWLPKRNFACLAANARVAGIHSAFDPRSNVLSLRIIGLASVAELGEAAGMVLDPVRFRANILFSGGPAFAELDWVGREILLGRAKLRVFKRTQRCAATEVNPETAERDAKPPRWLRQHYGHADMGVYAEVIEGGVVAVGDALELPEPG